MRPELPYLAAGAVALAGSVAKNKGLPSNGLGAIVATVALVIVTSASSGTVAAPAVRALGMLMLLAAVMSAVPAFTRKK